MGFGYLEGSMIFFDSFSLFSVSAFFAAAISFGVLGYPLANLMASLAMYFLLVSEDLTFEEVLAAVVYGRMFSLAPGVHIVLQEELGIGNTKAILAAMVGALAVLVLCSVPVVVLVL